MLIFTEKGFAQIGDIFKKDGNTQWGRLLSRMKPQKETPKTEVTFNTPPIRNPFIAQLPKKIDIPKPPKPGPKTTPGPTVRPVRPTRPVRPVRPVGPVQITMPSLEISGIVWNSERPQAIINQQVFSVGDMIQNTKIIDITKTGITILLNTEEVIIPYGSYEQN